MEWQLKQLREMRKERVALLTSLAKRFPQGVRVLVHAVHGGVERKILQAAEEHVRRGGLPIGLKSSPVPADVPACTQEADLVIIGKRKLGRLEKIFASWVAFSRVLQPNRAELPLSARAGRSVSNWITSHAPCSVLVAK